MTDVRSAIVYWARWGAQNHGQFTYSEGSERMTFEHETPGTLPIVTDCSGFVTLCYKWAGAPDPNGQNYDGLGYTGTLIGHGLQIPVAEVVPGDIVIYGDDPGVHTAVCVTNGPDPLTVSNGEQGDPSYMHVSQGNPTTVPPRFFRFSTQGNGNCACPPQPNAAEPTIQIGAIGGVVRLLQQHLGITADGAFGPQTKYAVQQYQARHGLTQDGIVGPQTWAALGL